MKRFKPHSSYKLLFFIFKSFLLFSCAIIPDKRKDLGASVSLPFMRLEPSECYYVDDFMPTPDILVSGKSGGLNLRYYTYKKADYKVWNEEKIMLAFFSRDNRCWSLFEEYSAAKL